MAREWGLQSVGPETWVSIHKSGISVIGDFNGLSERDAIHWAIAKLRERLKPEKKYAQKAYAEIAREFKEIHGAMDTLAERFGMDHAADAAPSYKQPAAAPGFEQVKKWGEWRMSQADTECLCGGPPGHVPGGMNCRKQ